MAFLPRFEVGAVPLPDGADLPYLRVGGGGIPVVVLPGAGDGLQTVRDAATQLAWFYRGRARRYRLLVLSRREPVPEGFGVERHAADLAHAVTALGWPPSIWECNSGGGPVGIAVATEHPELVRGLVLSSTFHRTSERTRAVLAGWLELLRDGRWAEFLWSTTELTFHRSLWRYRLIRPLLRFVAPRRHPQRIERVLEELLRVDLRGRLPGVRAPALVVGGEDDRIVPATVMREMAELLPDAELRLAAGYGHGNDLENPAYAGIFDAFAARAWASGGSRSITKTPGRERGPAS